MKLPKELTTITPISKILAAILFISLPFVGFFLGMRYQEMLNLTKRQQAESNLAIERIPTPTPLVIPTVDPSITANWKTYTDKNFTFRYPPKWILESIATLKLVTPLKRSAENVELGTASIDIKTTSNSIEQLINVVGVNKKEEILLDNKKAIKITGECCLFWNWISAIVSYNQKTIEISLGTQDQKLLKESAIEFDQILSTFRFINQTQATPTETVEGQFCGGIAGIPCPQGYECKLDGTYPDAGGKCIKL